MYSVFRILYFEKCKHKINYLFEYVWNLGRRSSSSSDGRHQADHRESFSLGQSNGISKNNYNNDKYKRKSNGNDNSSDKNDRMGVIRT